MSNEMIGKYLLKLNDKTIDGSTAKIVLSMLIKLAMKLDYSINSRHHRGPFEGWIYN